ncbi:hypothetical protein [Nitritalea halalkaliphila]|uniref:hypothetical protein n=1 Tax=Nitritalea halalkaliphila TaxID=590849 RepID=UPI001EE64F6A|nr:hypothetical protein [Nitritalea halalkaliphila]
MDNRQGDEYFYHMDLKSPNVFGHPSFGAYFGNDIPFDQGYLKAGEALLFKGGRSVFELYPFFYPQEFQSPFPPMEVKPAPVPREIEVRLESEFLINTTRAFEEEGYYFVQRDTNDTKGLLVKTVNEASRVWPPGRKWWKWSSISAPAANTKPC